MNRNLKVLHVMGENFRCEKTTPRIFVYRHSRSITAIPYYRAFGCELRLACVIFVLAFHQAICMEKIITSIAELPIQFLANSAHCSCIFFLCWKC